MTSIILTILGIAFVITAVREILVHVFVPPQQRGGLSILERLFNYLKGT